MFLMSAEKVRDCIGEIGLVSLMQETIKRLKLDYLAWDKFQKSARHAIHHPLGVLELMPCADDEWYSFKYVNGHPNNTATGKLCVAAFGMLAKQVDGYPRLLCDMTWLTAIRTACMTALVVEHVAQKQATRLGIIGTGAQAEFMLKAVQQVRPITHCYYYDIDPSAMQKFSHNMSNVGVALQATDGVKTLCEHADIIITITAAKANNNLIEPAWLKSGQLLCGVGGDCPGKTEFSAHLVSACQLVVAYKPQTIVEGELQLVPDHPYITTVADLMRDHSICLNHDAKPILFDSVGFALEDFSILMVIYQWLKAHPEFLSSTDWLPKVADPKNLYAALMTGLSN